MTKQEILDMLTEIGTCEDEVQRRTMLANVSNEVSTVFDTNATLTDANAQYATDNETLRSANLHLFLQVGQKQKDVKQIDGTGDEQPKEKLKFEDLFNEKGEIK